MKLLQKILATLATAGFMVAQPLAAQAAPTREPAKVETAAQLHGRGGAVITVVAVAALLGLLFWAVGLFDNSDKPHSP